MEDLETLPSLTEQLSRFSSGDRSVAEAVIRRVFPELHKVAVRELGRECNSDSISPTELINEVWLRNLGTGRWQVNSRQHFYAIAALAMRQVLVDFARTRLALKRGNGKSLKSLTWLADFHSPQVDLETLAQIGILMDRLEKRDPLTARIVDLHYFAGFTLEEVSEVMGLTFRQIRHRWERGRDWLKDGLSG